MTIFVRIMQKASLVLLTKNDDIFSSYNTSSLILDYTSGVALRLRIKVDRRRGRREISEPVNLSPLFGHLDMLQIGDPIYTKDRERLGHAVVIAPLTSFIIMADGRMQIRTCDSEENMRRYPFANQFLNYGKARESDRSMLQYIFTEPRPFETAISSTKKGHEDTFISAIDTVQALIKEGEQRKTDQLEVLTGIVPSEEEITRANEQDKLVRERMGRTIDLLAREGLGEPVTRYDDVVCGYALHVQDDPSVPSSRRVILMRTGNMFVVDDFDADQISRNAQQEDHVEDVLRGQTIVVTSSLPGGDKELFDENFKSAKQWLEGKREERRQRASDRDRTDMLLSSLEVNLTEMPAIERAKVILGEDYLGVEAIEAVNAYLEITGVEAQISLANIPDMPYSERDLELAKRNNEMLVLRPKTIIEEGALDVDITLERLMILFRNHRDFQAYQYRKDSTFAHNPDDMQCEWALVKKETLTSSANKDYATQENSIRVYSEELRGSGAAHAEARRRTATEVAWDTMAYYFHTGQKEKLLTVLYDRTSSVTPGAKPHIVIGVTKTGVVALPTNAGAYSNVGVCPTR